MHWQSLDDPSSARIELRGRALAGTRVAAVLWGAGWLVFEASAISQGIQHGFSVGHVVLLGVWTALGVFALVAIAWAAVGAPEVLTVSGRALQVRRGIGILACTQTFDGSVIRSLRVYPPVSTLWASVAAVRSFWDRGIGRIAFDVEGRTYAFGPSLDDTHVELVRSTILARLPAAVVDPGENEPAAAHSRRLRPGWKAHLMGWIVIAAFVFPLRLFITDLPICTEGAFARPYVPMDAALLRGDGRVVLVPFAGFSTEAARGVAEHFASKYRLDIVVASSLAFEDRFIDVDRGQASSAALIAALSDAYPETKARTIVIGLTDVDMFIPDVNWRYAFSKRQPPRFAIVSIARMDRGCMGLAPASSETRMARLRKMVGKNIGVLFYRLPLSAHPRSMMYGSVGGPQELDSMLEVF